MAEEPLYYFIEVDHKLGVAYLTFPPLHNREGIVARSQRVDPDIVLDFDQEDRLVGIEILNTQSA